MRGLNTSWHVGHNDACLISERSTSRTTGSESICKSVNALQKILLICACAVGFAFGDDLVLLALVVAIVCVIWWWFILQMYAFIFIFSKEYVKLGLKYFDTELGTLIYVGLGNIGLGMLFLRTTLPF